MGAWRGESVGGLVSCAQQRFMQLMQSRLREASPDTGKHLISPWLRVTASGGQGQSIHSHPLAGAHRHRPAAKGKSRL